MRALEHRGPDARGIHRDDGVALGIQRLRVIDLETGDQPIYNEDRSVVVVFNGEIYNYRELRDELEASGHRFATNGDTEVIVHLYEEHGIDCVRSSTACSRSRSGTRAGGSSCSPATGSERSRCYYDRDGVLSFASEMQALLEDEIPREVDHEALDAYLTSATSRRR